MACSNVHEEIDLMSQVSSEEQQQFSLLSLEEGGKEVKLYVPLDMMDNPLGFVVDAGGSVAKVIYRSKEEYSGGRLIKSIPGLPSDKGILRLRNFNMNQVGKVVDFLKNKCDVALTTEDHEINWWLTGVTTQHFKKNLEEAFHIKTKLYSEMMALNSFLKYFNHSSINMYETDIAAVEYGKKIGAMFFNIFETLMKQGDTSMIGTEKPIETNASHPSASSTDPNSQKQFSPLDTTAGKLIAGDDVKKWMEDFTSYRDKIETPALLIHMGSAVPIGLIDDNLNLNIVDYLSGAGKTLCGLSEELTGESNFQKFVKMAERGNPENVHLTVGDIKNLEHTDDDWYSIMPNDVVVFEMGKLASSNYKGKGSYGNEDLAVGLLGVQSRIIAKVANLSAKLYKAKTILFSGSLGNYKLVRKLIEQNLLLDVLVDNFRGGPFVKVHFIENPGFVCALGVWWKNVEIKKEQRSKETSKE